MTCYQFLLLLMTIATLSCGIMTVPFVHSFSTASFAPSAPSSSVQIRYGETIQGGLEDLGNYEFLGKAGDVVDIRMEATTFTPVLLLRNVDGSIAASDLTV